MSIPTSDRIYFPGLNGVRFIAASLVIVSHIEQFKKEEGLSNFDSNIFIGTAGEYGVSLFFVLSGFLITSLLLQENRDTGKIDIWKFYVRRMLRIWPLYYFILICAFFILPHFMEVGGAENAMKTSFLPKLLLFLFFLPNLALKAFPVVPFASQAWSIGTEEQFYLVWPWLLQKFKARLPWLLAGIPIFMIFLRKLLFGVCNQLSPGPVFRFLNMTGQFLDTFNIEFMAIGGLGAWLLFERKKRILQILFHPISQFVLFGILAVSLGTGLFGHVKLRYLFNALLFTALILNLAGNDKSVLKLENRLFRFMGKISYGLYMYHAICFYLLFHFFKQEVSESNSITWNAFLYLSVFLLTTGMAWISYELLEKFFLRKKSRYTLVVSGDGSEN